MKPEPRFEAQLEEQEPRSVIIGLLDDCMHDFRSGLIIEEAAFKMVEELTVKIETPGGLELQQEYNSIICAIAEELYWGGFDFL